MARSTTNSGGRRGKKAEFLDSIGSDALSDHSRSLTSEWLDSVEAAQFLKVSIPMLRNMASNGQVPFYKLGRRNRYRLNELEALLLKERRGPQ